jgi:hypothetical protein
MMRAVVMVSIFTPIAHAEDLRKREDIKKFLPQLAGIEFAGRGG